LLVVKRDREAAESVDTDAAFFADLEDQVAAPLLGLDFFFPTGITGL